MTAGWRVRERCGGVCLLGIADLFLDIVFSSNEVSSTLEGSLLPWFGGGDWLIRPWCTKPHACVGCYTTVLLDIGKWTVWEPCCAVVLVCGHWVVPAGRLESSHCSGHHWGLRGQLLPQPLCWARSFDLLTPLHHIQRSLTHTHIHKHKHSWYHTASMWTKLHICPAASVWLDFLLMNGEIFVSKSQGVECSIAWFCWFQEQETTYFSLWASP